MDDSQNLNIVKDFISKHNLAAVATVTSNALPEASVMGFYANDKLELFFGSFDMARKMQNLKTNPRIAVVIGWDQGKTVQAEGRVEMLEGEELEQFKKTGLEKLPTLAKYVSKDSEVFFKAKLDWLRYADYSQDPWNIFEVRFVPKD